MAHEESGEDLPDSGEDGQEAAGFFDLLAFSVSLTFFFVAPRLELEFDDMTK
jgi:hypothetical protein